MVYYYSVPLLCTLLLSGTSALAKVVTYNFNIGVSGELQLF